MWLQSTLLPLLSRMQRGTDSSDDDGMDADRAIRMLAREMGGSDADSVSSIHFGAVLI